MQQVLLNTNRHMPIIGLGTFKIQGADIAKCLDTALAAGYRSIDTAAFYRNEADIGTALKELLPKYGLTRADIFITSKLAPRDQGEDRCRLACLESLSDLQCDYLDLYLIHWPGTQGMPTNDSRNPELRRQSWVELEKLMKEGKLRSIGVSNYMERHLTELLQYCEIKPVVLQIEYHPHLVQKSLVEFCRTNGIYFQAYTSLGRDQLLTEKTATAIAEKRGKTVAQILLRWAVQHGVGVLPKSCTPKRIQENIAIFDFQLTDEEMTRLFALNENKHYCWDPTDVA